MQRRNTQQDECDSEFHRPATDQFPRTLSIIRTTAMLKYITISGLVTLLCSSFIESCSLNCGDHDRVCTNNIEGYIGADCSGLSDDIVCASESDPCMNECFHTSPILSKDGKSCQKCYTDSTTGKKVCPKCDKGEIWCGAEKLCKNKTESCDGQCSLFLYPILSPDGKTCEPCPEREIDAKDYDYAYYDYGSTKRKRWCKQSNQCYDPPTEPCNGKCSNWNKWYCEATDSCIDNTTPCEQKCNYDYWYCPETNACVSRYNACGETCFGDRRYCSLTKSCLDQEPCGSECPKGLTFCALTNRCQENDKECACPNDQWGCTTTCKNKVCNNSCHLKYNEPMRKPEKKKVGEKCVKNAYGMYLLNEVYFVGVGECHTDYKLCPGTATCIPNYQDEATGCINAKPRPRPTTIRPPTTKTATIRPSTTKPTTIRPPMPKTTTIRPPTPNTTTSSIDEETTGPF